MASDPVTSESQPDSSASASRSACQGLGATPSPSASASAASTAGPWPPIAAMVPEAPPHETTSRRGRNSASRARWRISGMSQPAMRKPKVVGVAG